MTFNRLHLIRQVDLFTLRLFLSVVEEEQIGRAAIRENIAASTATKRIHDLEEIAGILLFERTPKGVSPTAAGQVLARYVRAIFGNLDDMRAEIAAFSEGVRGEVTVASARTIIVPFLARELGDFSRDFPKVDVVVRELDNADITQAVAQGEADVGVFGVVRDISLNGVETADYRTDRLVAVVPRSHALADRGSVSFEDLMPENLIAASAMHATFATAARRLGGEYRPKFSVRSSGVAISLVQAGLGVTVQPECVLSVEMLDTVSVLNLTEPWAKRIIRIATPQGRTPSPAARALIKQLLDRPAPDSADTGGASAQD
ncbi:LysR family transcriptional regulator [Azohydromonas australica]|uniref:LysR family transcriptional regulator n=1 Tax=Azohydromonas australica TaxID=364039 RepID=UPI00048D228B|nr:LysR family transcriptional regulator [Azohydromonas australica]